MIKNSKVIPHITDVIVAKVWAFLRSFFFISPADMALKTIQIKRNTMVKTNNKIKGACAILLFFSIKYKEYFYQ